MSSNGSNEGEIRDIFSLGSLESSSASGGKFEILAITAGKGNGWVFGAAALQASLALWDKTECFVDHALPVTPSEWRRAASNEGELAARRVKDLAGVLSSPVWDESKQGIRATLRAVGPSAGVLQELGKVVLSGDLPALAVGFSADIIFTANGKEVQKILRVLSVDLVIDPARGGQFIRELYQRRINNEDHDPHTGGYAERGTPYGREHTENKESAKMEKEPERKDASDDFARNARAVRQLLTAQQEQVKVTEEAEKAKAIRMQMCEYLLSSGLAASHLPGPAAEQVRKQFAGKVFEPADLQSAIEDARKLVSDLTANLVVNGPGRIHGMFTAEDGLQNAVDDLLGAPRDTSRASQQTPRLSGIRELYMMLTGDYDLHGGYNPGRAQLATTADFTGLVKNALNKIVANKWTELGRAGYDWWQKICVVEHFNSLQSITGTLVGTVGSLPAVAEGAEYTELAVGDSPETASFTKYGGYIPLTLELIDRDETRKLAAYPRELAIAGLRKVSELVAAIFTANSGVGPTMADTGALFNATAVTTAGGHANLLTTALAAAQWEIVSTAVYNQPQLVKQAAGYYGTGPKMGINPRYLLVPRALQLTARKILYPSLENLANITSENQQQGSPGDVITVPEWTDATDWAAVVDPALVPGIFVGERFGIMPEIFIAGDENSPAVFTNDEHRMKVRHFLAVWVNDFRPLHKSNVAG